MSQKVVTHILCLGLGLFSFFLHEKDKKGIILAAFITFLIHPFTTGGHFCGH